MVGRVKGEPQNKSTKLEIKRRVQEVYKMLLSGISRAEIIQYVTETPKPNTPNPINRPWNVDDRQIDHYIARATKQFEALAEVDRKAEYGKAKARFEYIYKNTINVQDWKTALATEKARCDLLGLSEPRKLEYSADDALIAALTGRESMRQKLNDLKDRLTPIEVPDNDTSTP